MQVFDDAGNLVRTLSGAGDPVWLDAGTFEAYEVGQFPPADPNPDAFSQFHTVPGQSVDVASGAIANVTLPCCYAMSNGHGAVAVAKNMPGLAGGAGSKNPSFAVWQDGSLSPEHDGEPLAWDANGDKLAVLHATQPTNGASGSVEVLSWPGLTSLYTSDTKEAVDATFDPSGAYVSYAIDSKDGAGALRMTVDVADLAAGTVATIAIAGDPTKYDEGYFWNDQGQILTYTGAAPVLSTYQSDGTKIADLDVPPSTSFTASSDGTTLISSQIGPNGYASPVSIYRGGVTTPLNIPGEVHNFSIAPDGRQLLVIVGSDAGETAYLAAIPL